MTKYAPEERARRLVSRFWASTNKDGPTQAHVPHLGPCWEWTRLLDRAGYGILSGRINSGPKRMLRAHRVSWFIEHGVMPELCVLHRCDNRRCVRPSHLFLGTLAENLADMTAKGRRVINMPTAEMREKARLAMPRGENHYFRLRPELRPRGERSGPAKLTESAVRLIRLEHAKGVSFAELGRRFGVSNVAARMAAIGKTWSHVEAPARQVDGDA